MNKKMQKIESLARPAILALTPYSSARGEFSGDASIFLDANENSYGSAVDLPYVSAELNRYPDPLQNKLRVKLGELHSVNPEQIFLGNGSDEAIDLLMRVFCEPKLNTILITPPTYGMYQVSADIQGIEVQKVSLTNTFELDSAAIKAALTDNTKIVFICTPNNPTGNSATLSQIEDLAQLVPGLLVIDEAYIDFSDCPSATSLIAKHPNIVVLQTMSKAWGLAGIRVGLAFSDPAIIRLMQKIKAPYNISTLAQHAALEALQRKSFVETSVAAIKSERDRVARLLSTSAEVTQVFPSDANFLLVKCKDAKVTFNKLLGQGIVTRDRSSTTGCENCIRITIGTPEQNDALLEVFGIGSGQHGLNASSKRYSRRRKTKETDIKVSLTLQGPSSVRVDTGIGFLDHMVTLLATHAGLSLVLVARGDLLVDEHHTVEDCAIAFGECFREALGSGQGISRYGFYLPMDEASSQIALDISGRSFLVWDVPLISGSLGSIKSTLFQHFFKSFCDAAKITLHVRAQGQDDHHVIEAAFKGVGRSLRAALRQDGSTEIPSSKGVL